MQFLWLNKYIHIEDNPLCSIKLLVKKKNFLSQHFEEGSLKPWNDLKIEHNLANKTDFKQIKLKHAIPHKWKTITQQNPSNVSNLLIQDHHLIKGAQILTLDKLQ